MIGWIKYLLFVGMLILTVSPAYTQTKQNSGESNNSNRLMMVRIVWQPNERIQVPIKSVTARIPAALERMRANPVVNSSGGRSIFTVGSNSFVYRARPLNRTLLNFCAYTGCSTESELDLKLPAIIQAFQEEIPVLRTLNTAFYIVPQYSEYQPLILAFGPIALSNSLNPGSEIMTKYFSTRELYDDYLQHWATLNITTPPVNQTKLKELEDKRNKLQRELVKTIAKDKAVPENPDLIYRVHELYDPRSPQAIELDPRYLEWLEITKQQEQLFSSITDFFTQYIRSKGQEPHPIVIVSPTNLDLLVPFLGK